MFRIIILLVLMPAVCFAGYKEGEKAYAAGEYQKAFKEYLAAAEDGNAMAQLAVASMYRQGTGVTANLGKAFDWYRKAAMQGDPVAQSNLGDLYSKGEGVTKNYKQAVHWYRQAAKQGVQHAQWTLSMLYENGQGVAVDYYTAYLYMLLAADSANPYDRQALERLESALSARQISKAQEQAGKWKTGRYIGK